MTMQEAYQQGEQELLHSDIQEARLDAWYLLEHVTGASRAMYYAMPNRQLSKEQAERYNDLIGKRSLHIPLQHLTGVQEFMGLDFKVNEHVLIPRQDTEIAVEEALHVIRRYVKDSKAGKKRLDYKLLDMCTGSGCILLSILYHSSHDADIWIKGSRPDIYPEGANADIHLEGTDAGIYPEGANADIHLEGTDAGIYLEGTGTDVSWEALRVARDNALSLQIDGLFLESDLFENVDGRYHMIISNPPYIRTEAISTLQEEVRLHDPWIALDGRADGLYFYRSITEAAGRHLEKGGTLIYEIGSEQGEIVAALMKRYGFKDVTVKKDMAGLDRVVTGMYDT